MNILIVSQYFWPENFRINEISLELKKRKHNVTILTGLPNYGKGIIPKKYKHRKNRHELFKGIEIFRCFEIPNTGSIVSRFLNYFSFMLSSRAKIMKIGHNYDVIFFNELSPIMSGSACVRYKKKFGTKMLMYHMDLWPESLTAGGIESTSLIYKFFAVISSNIYRCFDKILVSTREQAGSIKKLKFCNALNIEYLPQFAEKQFECKPKILTAEKETYHVTFAGNLGYAQSLETIINAAGLLKNENKIIFDIFGSGQLFHYLKLKIEDKQLHNVILHGQVPISEMPKYYSQSDIMLVTLENKPYANKTLPGKVQTYMASGKPVFGSACGSTKKLIEDAKCGICVDSGDFKKLATLLRNVTYEQLNEFSINSYKYYLDHFNKDKFMDKLISELEALM